MFYLRDAVESGNSGPVDDQNGLSDVESFYDEDCCDYGSISSTESDLESLSDMPAVRADDDGPPIAPTAPPAFGVEFAPGPINFSRSPITETIDAGPPEEETLPIPRNKSIAHHDLKDNNIVWCSLDLETGGEYCGIIQLSAELFRLNPADVTRSDYIREPETFNHYVRPPDGTYWNEEACRRSHGLTAESPQIQSASPFVTVWGYFCNWISEHVGANEKCILAAYRGETCDMRWIWKHTQAPRSQLRIPEQIKYFMDPLEVINSYKTCPYHPAKSKLESLELGCVWKYNTGNNLNGAHDSLVDAKAQTDIIIHKHFQSFIDRTKSFRLVADIFSRAEQREMVKKMEPLRGVHDPWFEVVCIRDHVEWYYML
jgi:hypothetical protein